jgi:hypothetical protein
MDVVLLALNAWGAFGQVYAEWRTPWESKSKAYAEERALTFTHLASKLSVAMKAVSLSKHKSWYAFLTAWVVPRQMAIHGDLWAYGTSPVEQRGARLKKLVRNVISWRPYCDGWTNAVGPCNLGEVSRPRVWIARRKFESCAMMQLLRACVAQEEMWAEPILAPEQLSERPTLSLSVSERRMQQTGRTTLIKVERGRGHRLPKLVEDIIDLTV